jgi:large subunit ribosomal protein L23
MEKKATTTKTNSKLKNPRVTEKASMIAEKNVYTFDIAKGANKTEIKKAIFAEYKVKPLKVNIVNTKAKKTHLKGHVAMKNGGKKAMVFLKKGDKIDFA